MKPLLVATLIAHASFACGAQCLPPPALAARAHPTGLVRAAFTAAPAPREAARPAREGQWQLLLTGLALMAGIAVRRRGE